MTDRKLAEFQRRLSLLGPLSGAIFPVSRRKPGIDHQSAISVDPVRILFVAAPRAS
jgi:hypothetical protein